MAKSDNKSELNGIGSCHKDCSDRFDIQMVYDSFAKCCDKNDSLDMDHYIVAFKELYRFFSLLGTVFNFVAHDIISKVGILEEYRKSETGNRYATIQSMVEHETAEKITEDNSKPSGCRTLLRLHRSLEFIVSFMQDFSVADSHAKTSSLAQKCYKDTLSKHHPWLVQKGAYIAMYTLPARQLFIERVSGETCDAETVQSYEKLMGDISVIARKVYDETQKLYEVNGLQDLP